MVVLQFGYMTLFAPAFPFGFFIGYLNNLVELRSDGFKICMLNRRPLYRCAEDIGTWNYILDVMSTLSVITNATLLAITSKSLDVFTEDLDSDMQWTVKLLLAFGVEVNATQCKF